MTDEGIVNMHKIINTYTERRLRERPRTMLEVRS